MEGTAMGMAGTLRDYLDRHAVAYELLRHSRTRTSSETAEAAHVSGDRLAKPVVIEDDDRYLVVVIPASQRIDFTALHRAFGRQLGLATEPEVETLFRDCAPGAVPALAQAYGLDVAVDDALLELDDVYFEAGDHCELVHISGDAFRSLMASALHGQFSEPMASYGEGRRRPETN
ncbi:MAG: YbaK/EbsC family protein [Gammaproteobacteria bacterium]